jgi:hypothetical protein
MKEERAYSGKSAIRHGPKFQDVSHMNDARKHSAREDETNAWYLQNVIRGE